MARYRLLTAAQWQKIGPLLPKPKPSPQVGLGGRSAFIDLGVPLFRRWRHASVRDMA